ncbi:DUF6745 domain-containing protein [Nonomuraea sp. NPDC050328]|uniref:DUF6745 domain-containing protein n=1 Tax=Nonomuraea sp. NPDC050328 TaxID=3364361 RepID=UPI0037A3FD0F
MRDPAQREAAGIRADWLDHACSTRPADRAAAETAISGLYRLIGRDRPRFHWVSSPLAALATLPPGVRGNGDPADHPVARELTSASLDLRLVSTGHVPAALDRLVSWEISRPLAATVERVLHPALRAADERRSRWRAPWYETLSPAWVAHLDALARLGGGPVDERLGLWRAAMRQTSWWWPRDGVCVITERPVTLHTEPAEAGALRLHADAGPAVRYADGWEVHAWHGTVVPRWVIDAPSVGHIEREPNIEVRRCAIERLGWGEYLDRAGLRLVATAADPGNPGSELRLYDYRPGSRVLLAVNGSLERDGTRRRYGLTVPGFLDDPVAAAAWSYGLPAAHYAQLARRT